VPLGFRGSVRFFVIELGVALITLGGDAMKMPIVMARAESVLFKLEGRANPQPWVDVDFARAKLDPIDASACPESNGSWLVVSWFVRKSHEFERRRGSWASVG